MKRPCAVLDPTPSSPTRKRSRSTGHSASYPEAPTPASPSSTDSSTSTLFDSPPKSASEHGTTSSEPDESIPDTNSDTFSSSTPSELAPPSSHSSSTQSYNTDFWNNFPILPPAYMGREIEPDDINLESFEGAISDSVSISDDIPDSPVHLSSSPVAASDASIPSSPSASSSSSSSSSGASNADPPNPRAVLSTENLTRLQSRLGDFLPKIKSANEELEVERAEERLVDRDIENVDREEEEGREYIEMNLGLGVLEEKGKGAREGSEECEGGREAGSEDGAGDAVERLLRSPNVKGKGKIKIEEVES